MKKIEITETPEAITARCSVEIWEEYDAPGKRIKRARPIEYPFALSIEKVPEQAAPVAFVVEHFPGVTCDLAHVITPAWNQPIRVYHGQFYTPARTINGWNDRRDPDPREILKYAAADVPTIYEPYGEDIHARAAAHDIRADREGNYPRAEHVEKRITQAAPGCIIIEGVVWEQCGEPLYYYVQEYWHNGRKSPAHISVTTDATRAGIAKWGALDTIELAIYHRDTARLAYIDVKRPDLVTFDSRRDSLESASRRAADEADRAATALKAAREALKTARENVKKAEAAQKKAADKLSQYDRDPREYYRAYIDHLTASPFGRRNPDRAARITRIIDEKAWC